MPDELAASKHQPRGRLLESSLWHPWGFLLSRVFKSFQHRDFRLMWLGACTSTIGTWMQSTAQAWLVYDLSKDSFYLGLDTFLAQVPIILFSLVGGVIADRMNRRNL